MLIRLVPLNYIYEEYQRIILIIRKKHHGNHTAVYMYISSVLASVDLLTPTVGLAQMLPQAYMVAIGHY